jgi:hypothetical protein
MKSFIAVGNALLTIRDRRLYREGFKTFMEYCNARWGMGRAYANYLISGSQIAANLATPVALCTPCEIQPIHEKQVRLLAHLEPDQQREVWEEAVKTAPVGKVTYKKIWPGDKAFRDDFWTFQGNPLIYPLAHPGSSLPGPQDGFEPCDFHLLSPGSGKAFWAGRGIDGLVQHASRAAAFHREIIHNEFGGNPRVPGGINKQLSYEYHNNII